MTTFFERAEWRVISSCAPIASALVLAACGGGTSGLGGPLPQTELTVTGASSTASVQRGDSATFTFTVTNPGKATVDSVLAIPLPDASLSVQGVTCTTNGGACPTTAATTSATQTTYSMPPGSVFTFVVTTTETADLDGTVTMAMAVDSYARQGEVRAAVQLASSDRRDGGYTLFGRDGLEYDAQLGFRPQALFFGILQVIGQSIPTVTMASQSGYFTLSSGGFLSTGTDLVAGTNDFGNGPEPFVGARNFVNEIAALDGVSFATFNLRGGASAAAAGPVQDLSGALGIWQAAIKGTTLTMCTDSIGAIATCSPAALRHYALSKSAMFREPDRYFVATDSAGGDSFLFQVARSGTSLIWLRSAAFQASPSLFSVGLGNTQALDAEHDAYTTLGGKFGILTVTPTLWEFLAHNPAGDFGPSAVFPFTANSNDGIPGLLHGPRPSDGVELYMLHQGPLTLVGTLSGEFAIALDKP